MQAYETSSDPARLDIDAVHAFLSRTYWAQDMPREVLERALAHSLCFSAWHAGQQVGFARLVTDQATFAYLADVYVLEAHRGKGVSRLLMDEVMRHPCVPGLRRMMLVTRDAHGLYEKYGFRALAAPERVMELHRPRIYAAPE